MTFLDPSREPKFDALLPSTDIMLSVRFETHSARKTNREVTLEKSLTTSCEHHRVIFLEGHSAPLHRRDSEPTTVVVDICNAVVAEERARTSLHSRLLRKQAFEEIVNILDRAWAAWESKRARANSWLSLATPVERFGSAEKRVLNHSWSSWLLIERFCLSFPN